MQEPLPRRILVTGGSGVLGYHILHALVRDPRNQVIVPLRNPNNRLLAGLPVDAIHANLSDALQTGELIRSTRPDTVIHAAASGLRAPKPNWFETARFNVDAALRLFEATCEIADCHFIHISSGMAYRETGRPLCESDPLSSLHPYAASKAAGDLLLRAAAIEFNRRLTVLRPFSFTGLHDPAGRLFPAILQSASLHQPVELTAGSQIRDFCAVEDVADAVVRCLDHVPSGAPEVFNLGSGDAPTLRQLIECVCDELGISVELNWGAKPYHPYEPMHLVADVQRAQQLLGWQATTNLAFAVWQLAKADFPNLSMKTPRQQR